jgi:hypothetical protein
VTFSLASTIYSAPGDDRLPDVRTGWQISEFNVFGDRNSSQAVFNPGSTIVVCTSVYTGLTSAPGCAYSTFTRLLQRVE